MYIAHDEFGQRIYIDKVDLGKKYFCPVCDFELMIKDGEQRRKHFAHKNGGSRICDDWSSDMSDWHREWQEQFPEECREVIVENNGEKHRADVLINNIVVEFQHSAISREEFERRNSFYTSVGYRMIWLFDLSEDYEQNKYITTNLLTNSYDWKYHKKNFNGFNVKENDKIIIWFQLESDSKETKCLKHLIKLSDDCRTFKTEEGVSYNRNEFVDYIKDYKEIKENEILDKEPQTLRYILEHCDKQVITVENIVTRDKFLLRDIPRKQNYMRKNPYKDIWGCIGYYKYGFNKNKEYPIHHSDEKVWIITWWK